MKSPLAGTVGVRAYSTVTGSTFYTTVSTVRDVPISGSRIQLQRYIRACKGKVCLRTTYCTYATDITENYVPQQITWLRALIILDSRSKHYIASSGVSWNASK